jgi:hypothetical protein
LADKTQLDGNSQAIASDQSQVKSLSDADDANQKSGKPAVNAAKIAALTDEIQQKTQQNVQLKANYDDDSLAKVSNTGVTSMIHSIDTFTAALISNTVNSSSPSANAPASSGKTASSATTRNVPTGTAGDTGNSPTVQAASNSSSSSASASVPPLVSILYGDGIARALGATRSNPTPDTSGWRVITLKELESGSSVIARARFFGTKIIYAGGSAATYAVFDFDGNLYCSAIVYDYGGRIQGKSFNDQFRNADIDPSTQLLFSRGRCKPVVK